MLNFRKIRAKQSLQQKFTLLARPQSTFDRSCPVCGVNSGLFTEIMHCHFYFQLPVFVTDISITKRTFVNRFDLPDFRSMSRAFWLTEYCLVVCSLTEKFSFNSLLIMWSLLVGKVVSPKASPDIRPQLYRGVCHWIKQQGKQLFKIDFLHSFLKWLLEDQRKSHLSLTWD